MSRRYHPRGGLILSSHPTWAAAVEAALERRAACLRKYGPDRSHGWVMAVRRYPRGWWTRSRHQRWVVTFDQHRQPRG